MTVRDAIEMLSKMNQDSQLVVLKARRKANKLDDLEYDAISVIAFENGRRTNSFSGKYLAASTDERFERVVAIRNADA